MHYPKLKIAICAARQERGMTLVELLVVMATTTLVAAAAAYLLIVAVKMQPRISDRSYAIQQGRVLEERVTRELRASTVVDAATPSSITFRTYVRHVSCGGGTPTSPTATAIVCKVSYSCPAPGAPANTCSRKEVAEDVVDPNVGTWVQMVSGLSSNQIFRYEPPAAATAPALATYVGVDLEFPATSDDDAVTLTDGVDLRNR